MNSTLVLMRTICEMRSRRGHDHMVVGFTTNCAVRAYHH
jgi:hypothetical protein